MTDENVRRGASKLTDPIAAVDEIYEAVHHPESKLVVFFCSPSYDLARIESRMHERFGNANVIGCTTAGEIGTKGYLEHSLSAFSLSGADFEVATGCIEGLKAFDTPKGQAFGRDMLAKLRAANVAPTSANTFGFLLIDGLSIR